MKKVKALDKAVMTELKEAQKQVEKVNAKINKRIHYILDTIFKTYGKKLKAWWFMDAPFDTHGTLRECAGFVEGLCTMPDMDWDWAMILGEDTIHLMDEGFPSKWLYQDFEQELKEGKAAYEAKEQAEEAERKALDKKAKQEAKAFEKFKSLSEKEQKALLQKKAAKKNTKK
jgi:hypothetical protein